MNENIVAFLNKLAQDEETQKKLSACRDPEEAYQIAHAIQDGFTREEFIETMKSLHDQAAQDLNADDLAKTSGGGTPIFESKANDVALTVSTVSVVSLGVTMTLAEFSVIASASSAAV